MVADIGSRPGVGGLRHDCRSARDRRAALLIHRIAVRPRRAARAFLRGAIMSAFSVSYIVLWVLVAVLSLVVLALVRQIGVLHDRIAPTGALMLAKGLTVGEPAP